VSQARQAAASAPLLGRTFPVAGAEQRRDQDRRAPAAVDLDPTRAERRNAERRAPRILGLNGEWTTEKRLSEAAMAQNERRFSGAPVTGWSDLWAAPAPSSSTPPEVQS